MIYMIYDIYIGQFVIKCRFVIYILLLNFYVYI